MEFFKYLDRVTKEGQMYLVNKCSCIVNQEYISFFDGDKLLQVYALSDEPLDYLEDTDVFKKHDFDQLAPIPYNKIKYSIVPSDMDLTCRTNYMFSLVTRRIPKQYNGVFVFKNICLLEFIEFFNYDFLSNLSMVPIDDNCLKKRNKLLSSRYFKDIPEYRFKTIIFPCYRNPYRDEPVAIDVVRL